MNRKRYMSATQERTQILWKATEFKFHCLCSKDRLYYFKASVKEASTGYFADIISSSKMNPKISFVIINNCILTPLSSLLYFSVRGSDYCLHY